MNMINVLKGFLLDWYHHLYIFMLGFLSLFRRCLRRRLFYIVGHVHAVYQ